MMKKNIWSIVLVVTLLFTLSPFSGQVVSATDVSNLAELQNALAAEGDETVFVKDGITIPMGVTISVPENKSLEYEGGALNFEAGSKYIYHGTMIIGTTTDNTATLQLTSGTIITTNPPWDKGSRWFHFEGNVIANKNLSEENGVPFFILHDGWTLTIKQGVSIECNHFIHGTLIFLRENGKVIVMKTNEPSEITEKENETTAKITFPAIDTSDVTAMNKLELSVGVLCTIHVDEDDDDNGNIIQNAKTNIVRYIITIPDNLLNNENICISELLVSPTDFWSAKDSNKTLVFDIVNSAGKILYSWGFDGSKVMVDPEWVEGEDGEEGWWNFWDVEEGNFNMSLVLSKNLPANIEGDNAVAVTFYGYEEKMPVSEAGIKLYVGDQGFNAGDKVSFYYYNPETSKYELIAENLIVDAAGYVKVTITHYSDYVLNKPIQQATESPTGNPTNSPTSTPSPTDSPNNTPTNNPTSKPTAAAPKANRSKNAHGDISVTLTCDTKDAKIYYTLDGTEPTLQSNSVDSGGKVTISKTSTLKFMAVAEGYESSIVVSIKYTVITSPPSAKAVPKNKTVKKGSSIKLTAPKGVTLYYTVNGKNPTDKIKTKVLPGKNKKIKIKKKITLKVAAKKSGCQISKAVKRVYKVKK